jgi:protein MpaA
MQKNGSRKLNRILAETKTKSDNSIKLIQTGKKLINCGLIIGVVHGDEPQGKFIIEEYLKTAKSDLLFIPCLNPDGMDLKRRTNLNGVDLNRNFPTENWGQNQGENATCNDKTTDYWGGDFPASEIETQFVIDTIEKYKPSVILTIHSPYKVVNYDGPAKDISQEISRIIGYPAEDSIGYPTPGSFGNWAGVERNIPTITLELDENKPIRELFDPMFKIFELIAQR